MSHDSTNHVERTPCSSHSIHSSTNLESCISQAMAFNSGAGKRKLSKEEKERLTQVNLQEIINANSDHFGIVPAEEGRPITQVGCKVCIKVVQLHKQEVKILCDHGLGSTHNDKKLGKLNQRRQDLGQGPIPTFSVPKLSTAPGSKRTRVRSCA